MSGPGVPWYAAGFVDMACCDKAAADGLSQIVCSDGSPGLKSCGKQIIVSGTGS